jgi:ABC-type Fe3+/spermidine/putrescine transport system ATPase subunit
MNTYGDILPSFDRPLSREEPVISFRNISKSFGSGPAFTPAVDDVSLDIAGGSFVSLLGPSGCGKTTLLNLIAGLVTTDTGRVFYKEKEIRAQCRHWLYDTV